MSQAEVIARSSNTIWAIWSCVCKESKKQTQQVIKLSSSILPDTVIEVRPSYLCVTKIYKELQ